jgi:hypothetical protein
MVLVDFHDYFYEHKVFDEMLVREKCCHNFTCDSCLYRFMLFAVLLVPNPVSIGNSFYIARWS